MSYLPRFSPSSSDLIGAFKVELARAGPVTGLADSVSALWPRFAACCLARLPRKARRALHRAAWIRGADPGNRANKNSLSPRTSPEIPLEGEFAMSTMYRLALILLLLGAATPTPAAVVDVRLENFRFVPNDVTIQPGDTVRWTNQMGFHDVRADDGSFSRPRQSAPWTFERTFTRAGEVFVHCSPHSVPGADINSAMNGRINVANVTVVPGADIAVNTVSDELNTDGDCSLREAITSANSNLASDACAIGGGADSIGFGVAGTIVLNSALPAITSDVAIVGPAGDKVIISGGGTAPLFVVASGGILRLDALTLSGGFAASRATAAQSSISLAAPSPSPTVPFRATGRSRAVAPSAISASRPSSTAPLRAMLPPKAVERLPAPAWGAI
jgi:CSLREA domain-containing protein